jgi:hypothetical protein
LNNNRQYIIAVKAVSIVDIVIEPILILPEKLHLEHFYRDLKDNILVGLSDTGYINDKLTFTYIQHFKRQS